MGLEYELFAGASVHSSARKFYMPEQEGVKRQHAKPYSQSTDTSSSSAEGPPFVVSKIMSLLGVAQQKTTTYKQTSVEV